MSVTALSSAGFSQYVTASSNITASQQALQSLQQALAAGNLNAAQTAFNTYKTLNQNLLNASGGSSTTSQLSTDLTTLGTAISSGDLSAAQSAFTAVQNDAKATTSPAIAAALAAAAQTVSEIEQLLSSFSTSSTSSSTSSDPLTQILDTAYGQNASTSGAPSANGNLSTPSTTDPTTAVLQGQYGTQYGSSTTSNATSSGSGVNAYA